MDESIWSVEIGSLEGRIQGADPSKLVMLARKCVCHAYAVNRERFRSVVPGELVELAELAVAQLGRQTGGAVDDEVRLEIRRRLGELESLSDSHGLLVPGWDAAIDSFVAALGDDVGDLAVAHRMVWGALENAYMSISDFVIHKWSWKKRGDGHGVAEGDSLSVERASALCVNEIAFQMKAIDGLCPE